MVDWDSNLEGGSYFTGVVRVEHCCGAYTCRGCTLQRGVTVRVFLQHAANWDAPERITLINFLVQEDADGWCLIQTEQGRFFLHGPLQPGELLNVKEACCGIGALGRGLGFLGYKVVAQNDVQLITVQEAVRLSGAVPVHGDISRLYTVLSLWDARPGNCTLAAGVACQPYSILGDQRSFQDSRASTLPGTLRAGYLMQCSCIILECVPQVLDDDWVQQVIQSYSETNGHVARQAILSLRQVWTAKRERWWCIIACPAVVPPQLLVWKPHGPWRSVSDVIDCFNVSKAEESALSLTQTERDSFASLKPLPSYCIQLNQPLPTALHSWGSPLSPCPCGCRKAPFTWQRLKQAGICSVLVKFGDDDGSGIRFRYPSAAETALLNGLSPCLKFGEPRLSLALVGQLASPLQAAWVGVQIASRLSLLGVHFPSSLDGVQVLHTQRRLLLRDAELIGFRPMTVPGTLSHCPSIVYETHKQVLQRHNASLAADSGNAKTLPLQPLGVSSALPTEPPLGSASLSGGLRQSTPVAPTAADGPAPRTAEAGGSGACNGDESVDVAPSLTGAPAFTHRSLGGLDPFPVVDPVWFGSSLPSCGLGPWVRESADIEGRMRESGPQKRPGESKWPLAAPVDAGPPSVHVTHRQAFEGFPAPLSGLDPSPTDAVGASRPSSLGYGLDPSPCSISSGSQNEVERPHKKARSQVLTVGFAHATLAAADPSEPILPVPRSLSFVDSVGEVEQCQAMPPSLDGLQTGWNSFTPERCVPALQAIRASFAQVPCFLAVDSIGHVLPLTAPLVAGKQYWLWVPNGAATPSTIAPPCATLAKCWPCVEICLPASVRKACLPCQGTCLADDQIAHALAFIAGCGLDLQVLAPHLLLKCIVDRNPEPLRAFVPAMIRGCTVMTCVPLAGHWVSFAWSILGGKVQAWVSMPGVFLAEDISVLHWLWGKAVGLSSQAFGFCEGPVRPPVPGLCGHYAVADLCCWVLGQPFQDDSSCLCIAACIAASFECSLQPDKLVSAPMFVASGAGELIEKGLASLLRDRGVPAERASARATQAVQRLGLGAIQNAMCSPHPWRCLKQLGSNATPAFQFVLHDELAQAVQARSENAPSGRRQRKKQSPQVAEAGPAPSVPPLPDQVRVPAGVFASEGQPLHQIELQAVDAHTQGVALVNPEQAAPYLRLARPVSSKALALVILGEPDLTEAAVHVEPIRFRAELTATSEPVLLQGVLAQIGDKWCERHVPSTTPVEVAASSVARVAVYRDSLPMPWDEFIAAPLRSIVSQVSALQPCDVMGCECQKYHGEAGPNDPPPILESWSRQFFGPNFKPCAPASATLFNLLIRVPAALEGPLQAVSGLASIYFEPRAEGLRMPSSRYAVIWMPKQEYQDVLLLMQTHDLICGLARIGDRFGVRCRSEHEEQLHSLLRPSVAWVDRSKLRRYESGPWPFGTQRANLVKALAAFGWRARPGQPIQGHRGGLWFIIEAESPPPQDSLHASFGVGDQA